MALIKTVDELKPYLRLPSTNASTHIPDVATAEERYLIPILGDELYIRLSDAYETNELTPALVQLLQRSRAVIAPMAYFTDLPFLQSVLSDKGVTVMENSNARKAFRWEYEELKEGLASKGYAAMEALIIFLRAKREDFPEWASAGYNDPEQVCILRDGTELYRAVAIQQPHRCFILLAPMLPMLCRLQIMPVISEPFYEHFNRRIIADDLNAVEKQLASLLQIALGRLIMAQAGTEMSVTFSSNGFTIVDQLKDRPLDGTKDPGDARLERWCKEMERTGFAYLNQVKEFLVKNAEEPAFAIFKESSAFPKNTGSRPVDNSKYKGVFRLS